MKRILLTLALASAMFGLSSSAEAAPRLAPGPLEYGIQTGKLTPGEIRAIQDTRLDIERFKRAAAQDGYLSTKERAIIRNMERSARAEISALLQNRTRR